MNIFEKGLITVLVCHLLFSLLSIPLILRRVPPNPVYGFRTPRLLRDPVAWYDINAHFGRHLLVASIAIALLFPLFIAVVSPAPDIFLPISLVALTLPLVVAGIASSQRLRSLPPANPRNPRDGHS